MNTGIVLLVITVIAALLFDFFNGFHDAANSIATVVSTRVLSPRLAVAWAAAFNFIAAFLLGTAVAKTIGQGMIQLDIVARSHRRLCRSRYGSRRRTPRMVFRARCHHRLWLDEDTDLHRGRAPGRI